MDNIIIIIILIAIVCAAIVPFVKHFKGQGGCCGGSSYKPKKKKLDKNIAKKIFLVEGMHCENCSNKVTEAVNDISGVSAEVFLKKKTLVVSYAKHVEDFVIINRIEKVGYHAVVMSENPESGTN